LIQDSFLERLDKLKQWFPIIMEDKDPDEVMPARNGIRNGHRFWKKFTQTCFKALEEHFDIPATPIMKYWI
jgi:hypothetical protein